MGDDYTRKAVSDYLNRTVQGGGAAILAPVTGQAHHDDIADAAAYALKAISRHEVERLKKDLEHAKEQWRMWRNKAQGFELQQDAMKRCHPGENKEPKSDIPEVGITEMHVMGPGGYSKTVRVDLDRMRYENRASSDRSASKALVEQEPWHAGLDPDDP